MENKRHDFGPKFIREVSIGPVDKALQKRAEWMIGSSKIQEYLAPQIKYTDRLAGKVEEGLKIACVGAGKGHEMDEIDSVLPGTEIIGIDPHDYKTRPVKKRLDTLAHNSTYLPETASAENLEGIQDNSLDAVTLYFVLHHTEEKNQDIIFNEVKRVLKDRGKVFVAEDLVNDEEEKKKVEKIDRVLNVEIKDAPHNYRNTEEWQAFFKKHGFNILEANEEKPDKVRHGFFVLEKADDKQSE